MINWTGLLYTEKELICLAEVLEGVKWSLCADSEETAVVVRLSFPAKQSSSET